jgi:phosphatidylglycerophosphate synthase
MPEPWVLELIHPAGDPRTRVGGLTLALRLALDAQWAGASAVAIPPEHVELRTLLRDARLRIPLVERAAERARVVRVPASYVVHRGALRALADGGEPVIELRERSVVPDLPFSFAPIDVIDDVTRRRAERVLFRSLRKPQDGWTSRWLNRYISLSISRLLVKTPLSPNQISVGILAVGLTGAWLASRGDYASIVWGACLFQAQSVLDGCDGEMSRVSYRGSLLGEWLDTIGDDLTNYGFFAGAGIGLYRASDSDLYLLAGLVTVFAGLIASGLEYRYLVRIGSGDLLKYPLSDPASPSTAAASLDVIKPLFKRDTFVLLTLLAALAGLIGPMLVLFAAAAVGILINVLAAERRMAKERRDKLGHGER